MSIRTLPWPAGLVPMADAPQAWTVYVSSDDLDATVAAIITAGGTVVAGPHPVGDLGSMVVALDPAVMGGSGDGTPDRADQAG